MTRMNSHHQQLNDQGEGRCSVPMFSGVGPAGFCDKPAYVERPDSPERYNHCSQSYYREDGRYSGYVPGLACRGHGGPEFRTFKDGDAWCAVKPDFIDLQASVSGFGDTREAAIAALKGASHE